MLVWRCCVQVRKVQRREKTSVKCWLRNLSASGTPKLIRSTLRFLELQSPLTLDKPLFFIHLKLFVLNSPLTVRVCVRVQAVAAALQARASRRGPGAGQGEDAGGPEIKHPQVGPGGVSPRYAAPQQGAGRPQQRDQRQRLTRQRSAQLRWTTATQPAPHSHTLNGI